MSDDVWSARDTTPDQIADALRQLLRERHAANESLAPARVLNLVVVVDKEWKGEVANRLERVGRYHASRTVLCTVEPNRDTLDAQAVMAYEEDDGLGVIRERVQIDIGAQHLDHLQTIVDPVVVAELPTVLWCPHGHEQAIDELLEMIEVVLLDSDERPEAQPALARAQELLEAVYVVDLAWLRTTPWRERLAASFDPATRRTALREISAVAVRHREGSTASALLLTGWLTSRLRWEAASLEPQNGTGLRGAARRGKNEIALQLATVEQEAPGLAGVTVECQNGFLLSLDRAAGGLRAESHQADGPGRSWRVLGASRGEGGILGEGVRQALLRDPTYGPALDAARGYRSR